MTNVASSTIRAPVIDSATVVKCYLMRKNCDFFQKAKAIRFPDVTAKCKGPPRRKPHGGCFFGQLKNSWSLHLHRNTSRYCTRLPCTRCISLAIEAESTLRPFLFLAYCTKTQAEGPNACIVKIQAGCTTRGRVQGKFCHFLKKNLCIKVLNLCFHLPPRPGA